MYQEKSQLSTNMDLKPLPKVIVLKPPTVFKLFEQRFSEKFEFLKAWESSLSTTEFLKQNSYVTALLTSGVTSITAEILGMLPFLKVVVTTSAGLDHIDMYECRRRGIPVANAGTLFSSDVADTAVGLLLDVMRRISASDRYVRGMVWPVQGEYRLGFKLSGMQVGIVGLGSIGLEVAKRLEAFGCSILYNSRRQRPSIPYTYYQTVLELAANCTVLVISCELNDQTCHVINKDVLLALGNEGVVVNIARGAVINEKEFVRCLVEGQIRGAGLDVFEDEPKVPRELLALDNVVMSPHSAVFTEESMLDMFELVSGNLEAFFSDKPLLSPVIVD